MLLWKHPLFEGVTHWQQPVCCSWWISVIFIRSISVPFTCWISVACVIFNCCGFCLFGAWPSFCDMTGRGTACDVRTWLPYSTAHHLHILWDVKTSKPWWSNQKSITSLLVQDVLYKFLSLKVYFDIFIRLFANIARIANAIQCHLVNLHVHHHIGHIVAHLVSCCTVYVLYTMGDRSCQPFGDHKKSHAHWKRKNCRVCILLQQKHSCHACITVYIVDFYDCWYILTFELKRWASILYSERVGDAQRVENNFVYCNATDAAAFKRS